MKDADVQNTLVFRICTKMFKLPSASKHELLMNPNNRKRELLVVAIKCVSIKGGKPMPNVKDDNAAKISS